jgi:hypothetical protein
MNHKLIILGLLLLPAITRAQGPEKCSDIVALPKELYDSFQIVKNNLNGADREITKYRESRNELLKKYLGCENQSDVVAMLKQAYESLQTAENNRKTWGEPFARIEVKVRQFIVGAHGKSVEYRYYDAYGGGKLGTVVTTIFTIVDEKVITSVSTYQLSEPMLN